MSSTPDITRKGIRLQTVVGIAIVLVSVMSAVVTWRAAEASGVAADRDRQARQDLLLKRQLLALHEADVSHEAQLHASYTEHVRRARDLERRARLTGGSATLSRALNFEAQDERALARALDPMFTNFPLDVHDRPVYEPQQVLLEENARDEELRELHPERLRRSAEEARSNWVDLVAVDTGLIAAIFVLTLSQLLRPRASRESGLSLRLAVVGGLLAVTSTVLFLVVGW